MNTTLHSFMDIFDTIFTDEQETVQLKKIVIPIIQRDYAQGRTNSEVTRVRKRFLDTLYRAVTEKPVTLDFVYGDIDNKGIMTPLDGQQRLTTLFLLHWYAAKKEHIPEEECEFLKNFSYETRYSARYFCVEILSFNPTFDGILSEEIINQSWFPLDWQKDPTISSMLVMLDAINEKFHAVANLWEQLKNKAITFYFLPIKDMGLTDELYIKMNSRGKPLTMFEHFKAELEREIRIIDEKTANKITNKIDCAWTDLLWKYRNSNTGLSDDYVIDDEFLRYFKFICDVICYKNGESPQNSSNDEFDLLQMYFSSKCNNASKNIIILESFFDCWLNIPKYDSPSSFLNSFMSHKHEVGKILVEQRYNIDIFEDCLHSYSDRTGRIRQFPLNRIVLLYAITIYLQHIDSITEEQFARRIRIVNNLIQNSEDEISDRSDRNRMPAILAEIDSIIINGIIDDSIENNFNVNQLEEEKEKVAFLTSNPDMSEQLFTLEDHNMLHGQISIVGIENLKYASRFISLFNCDWDKIDCALMATGDYSQIERNGWRYQFASSNMSYAWNALFHKSANDGYENTKNILITLLSSHEEFTNDLLRQIADSYLKECEDNSTYPFRYYYIKYPVYRPGSFGKFTKTTKDTSLYLYTVLQTRSKWSQNSYIPFLKAADDSHISKDDLGQRSIHGNEYIECTENAYLRKSIETNAVIETIEISQNNQGIDTEDRILKLKNYLRTVYTS